MKKTIADLKRDLSIGTGMEMLKLYDREIPEKLQGVRYVVKVKSNGIELNKDKDATKGSFLDYPRASLCDYDGETLTVYDSGSRELTVEEKNILDNVPSHRPENREKVIEEAMTDGSGFYYKDKAYYKENGCEYLSGHETVRGLKYDFNTKKVQDENIKGSIALQYKIIK